MWHSENVAGPCHPSRNDSNVQECGERLTHMPQNDEPYPVETFHSAISRQKSATGELETKRCAVGDAGLEVGR